MPDEMTYSFLRTHRKVLRINRLLGSSLPNSGHIIVDPSYLCVPNRENAGSASPTKVITTPEHITALATLGVPVLDQAGCPRRTVELRSAPVRPILRTGESRQDGSKAAADDGDSKSGCHATLLRIRMGIHMGKSDGIDWR